MVAIHDSDTNILICTQRMFGVPREGDTVSVVGEDCRVVKSHARWDKHGDAEVVISVTPISHPDNFADFKRWWE